MSATDLAIVKDTVISAPMGLLDLLYGRGNYTRVSDQLDQLWSHGANGTSSITLDLRYAGLQYQLGIDPFPQATASTLAKQFTPLATVIGTGFSAKFSSIDASFAHVLSADELQIYRTRTTINGKTYQGLPDPFAWLLKTTVTGPHQTSDIWSTLVTQNSDGLDHVVTYKVGSGSKTRYVLAFEDQRGGGDFAYNDVIFEVSIASHSTPRTVEPRHRRLKSSWVRRLSFQPASDRSPPSG